MTYGKLIKTIETPLEDGLYITKVYVKETVVNNKGKYSVINKTEDSNKNPVEIKTSTITSYKNRGSTIIKEEKTLIRELFVDNTNTFLKGKERMLKKPDKSKDLLTKVLGEMENKQKFEDLKKKYKVYQSENFPLGYDFSDYDERNILAQRRKEWEDELARREYDRDIIDFGPLDNYDERPPVIAFPDENLVPYEDVGNYERFLESDDEDLFRLNRLRDRAPTYHDETPPPTYHTRDYFPPTTVNVRPQRRRNVDIFGRETRRGRPPSRGRRNIFNARPIQRRNESDNEILLNQAAQQYHEESEGSGFNKKLIARKILKKEISELIKKL